MFRHYCFWPVRAARKTGIAPSIQAVCLLAVVVAGLWLPPSSFAATVIGREYVVGTNFVNAGATSASGAVASEIDRLLDLGIYQYAATGGSATGIAGNNTWLLRNYATVIDETGWGTFRGASADTISSWTDTVTVTGSSEDRVTLRFFFSATGYLSVGADLEDVAAVAGGEFGLSTVAPNLSGGVYHSNYVVSLRENIFTTPDDNVQHFESSYENNFEGLGLVNGYFEGSGYYDVGVFLNQQDANGLWYGSSDYTIRTESAAIAAQGFARVDFGHTVLLTSVSLGDSGATPESLGYALSFQSGLVSPNVDVAAVPEPASLLAWSGFSLLGLAAGAVRRRRKN